MLQYPPPHYILFEPLNDVETQRVWREYKSKHSYECEFNEIDAAEINTVEDFIGLFNNFNSFIKGMFFFMRKDIFPQWEDENNINGGYWSYKIGKNIIAIYQKENL
mgnify:CR=1 FL=1